jgi:hypothetical protein
MDLSKNVFKIPIVHLDGDSFSKLFTKINKSLETKIIENEIERKKEQNNISAQQISQSLHKLDTERFPKLLYQTCIFYNIDRCFFFRRSNRGLIELKK